VLISGATGGVGTAAVQLAHGLGAVVVASARDTTHHAALKALGADIAVVPDDVASEGPYDVVLELVGASSLSVAAHALAPWARLVVIGVAAGGIHFDVDLLRVMQGRWTLTGSTLRSRSITDKAAVADAVHRDVLPLFEQGRLSVVVQQALALEQIDEAYEAFARPGKLGKFVLTTGARPA
jgi:NADPH:quinone reductase-like Zn-dependent oxidoreductase